MRASANAPEPFITTRIEKDKIPEFLEKCSENERFFIGIDGKTHKLMVVKKAEVKTTRPNPPITTKFYDIDRFGTHSLLFIRSEIKESNLSLEFISKIKEQDIHQFIITLQAELNSSNTGEPYELPVVSARLNYADGLVKIEMTRVSESDSRISSATEM